MLLAALQHVEKFYGDQTVLESAGLELRTSSRIALIGRNGAGKSTVLRLLMGLEQPDKGTVYVREGIVLGMLEQDPIFSPQTTVLQLAKQAFEDLQNLEDKLCNLEEQGLDKSDVYNNWEEIHQIFERRGGYERRSRRDSVLHALGFKGREQELATHFSGGEKTRLGLAKLLMRQPDVLLLDEPTNHLDMEMREWLENYLSRYLGGVVIVSHDRAFLDGACNKTAEIALGKLRSFDGNPSSYQKHHAEQLQIEEATRANQQKEHERLDTAAKRMKKWAGQNAKLHRRAKSMEKRLERYADQMLPAAELTERTTSFSFDCESSAEIVLQAKHLSKSFDHTLFKDVDLTIRQGERIALVGPNGAGKSSFLRVILGESPSDNPKAELNFGNRVHIGYYDQELKGVNPEFTLIEELIRLVGDREAHNLLGHFLFPYDAQFKKISELSGGEKARLALLKLTLGEYNFLILDEPTNHLDLEMIVALEKALTNYSGTLLIVSHDRRFIANTTNLIWELRKGQFTAYLGDWEYYQFKHSQQKVIEDKPKEKPFKHKKVKADKALPSAWQLKQNLEGLEIEIANLEKSLVEIADNLAQPEELTSQQIADLGQEHQNIEALLLEKMQSWEEFSELLEAKTNSDE